MSSAGMQAEYDALIMSLRGAGVGEAAAARFADAKFGRTAKSIDTPTVDDDALEKRHELEGDRLMQKLGFEVIKFSHPGKTKQTEGIADRRYYRRPRTIDRPDGRFHRPAVSLWWEAKSASGRQRPGQKVFQELVTACDEAYVLGTIDDLVSWLVEQRIAVRNGNTLEPVED